MGAPVKKISRLPYLWNCFCHFMKGRKYRYRLKEGKIMKINIIVSEEGWIIHKFGEQVFKELKTKEFEVDLTDRFNPDADINHYFAPNNVGDSFYSKVNEYTTFMVTHIDTMQKLDRVRKLTEKGAIGICMSRATRDFLVASGIARNRICYINPAQDQKILPRKVVLGFTHRLYHDNRKRNDLIIDVCKEIDPNIFRFVIMGTGWEDIVAKMKDMGFEVEYYTEFDKEKYNELMPFLDYYCYFGFDEGSMGFLDAMAAGIGTIVTPQGYHLDTNIEITYPVSTLEDIVDALKEIEGKRKKHIDFTNTWTWNNYTKKHIEIWKYMLRCEQLDILLENRGKYVDGIFSLLLDDLEYYKPLAKILKDVQDKKRKDK